MKIMLGTLAGAASGSMGNMTASHNRGGYYLRMRVIPTKVVSAYTTEVRNIMAACSQAWAALTAEAQAAWSTWAATHPVTDTLGQRQTLFGAQAYTQLNARILLAGDAVIGLPPISAAPAALTAFSAAPLDGAGTCVLTFLPTPLAATERLWLKMALVNNPGVNYFKNLMKTVYIGALTTASLVDAEAELQLRFGTMIEGQILHCQAQVYESTSGLLSGAIYHRIAVAA